jgi:hypothetical protein
MSGRRALRSCNNSPCWLGIGELLVLAAALRGEPNACLRRDFTSIEPRPQAHP